MGRWGLLGRRAWGLLAAGALASGLLAAGAAAVAAQRKAQPNIVLIVADDLGYGDLSAYGGPYPTPNIDGIARDGVRLTQGYVTAAVCSPSRAALMTGRYQQRFGHEYQIRSNPEHRNYGVDVSQPTLARQLKAAGYRTGLVGKWHLGVAPERNPLRMGFDEFFGFLGGETQYLDPNRPDVVSAAAPGAAQRTYRDNDDTAIQRNGQPFDLKTYTTTAFTDEAVGFIRRNARRPFLLVVTYNAPHTPLQATPDQLAKVASVADPATRLYRAVINEMDEGVGRIRGELARAGLTGRTLVIFISDNGCPEYVGPVCSNRPLQGFKRLETEGGVRVPFMMSWPGHIPAGRAFEGVSSSLDIFATAAAAGGARSDPANPPDGKDLVPYLSGRRSGSPHPTLYWKAFPSYAIRDGQWKLVVNATPGGGRAVMLFDVAADPAETRDLAAQNPDVVARLQAAWTAWNRALPAPRWPKDSQFEMQINGTKVRTTI